jgi:hypothetical protein
LLTFGGFLFGVNMPDPLDAINRPAAKPWWQSKTIWGLAITAVSIVAPKYQPIAQVLPSVIDQLAAAFGLVLGVYGRFKAAGPIK